MGRHSTLYCERIYSGTLCSSFAGENSAHTRTHAYIQPGTQMHANMHTHAGTCMHTHIHNVYILYTSTYSVCIHTCTGIMVMHACTH